MKHNKLIKNLLIGSCMIALLQGCDSEDDVESVTDFGTIASTYYEADGTGIVTIPVRAKGGALSASNISFDGTAEEGTDYEFVGVTGEGVQIRVLDDANLELPETLRVTIGTPGGNLAGNSMHTLTIISNCEDAGNPFIEYFIGDYAATEKYGPTPGSWYGPYTIHLIQDEDDPTMFHFDNLYDSGCDAYMVFDLAAGTVYFPDQSPCGVPLTNSSGTFTIDECNGSVLNINLNFDGGDWLYTFEKL